MGTPEKDYTRTGWMALAGVIALLAVIGFIPPQRVGSVTLRRANILSDLIRFDDSAHRPESEEQTPLFDEEEFRIDMEQVSELIEADTAPRTAQITFEWSLPCDCEPCDSCRDDSPEPDSTLLSPALIPIEDFSREERIRAFCDTLLHARRPVRIAVLGDSFIEGDILTADLREQLQLRYGGAPGGGAGFAPMASPLTAFRRTVKTASKGWTSHNIMQHKRTPEQLRDKFFVSGWVCQPSEGASTRWEASDYRRKLDACATARILFLSPSDSRVEVLLNDTLRQEFRIEGDAAVRQILVDAPRIRSLEFRVKQGTEGFVGYGALLEGRGVTVDNYSVRSNNGQAMFRTNPSVNAQIDALAGYDLVILQYGLNIMQQGVRAYAGYGAQIEKMVAYVRQCFPRAAVLVLGVSDRSVKTEAGFEPMDAIDPMLECQRAAARNTGAAFWSTCEAMRSWGGMAAFVQNGWAGKDYTHINYAGGQRVAWSLVDAIEARCREIRTARLLEKLRREAAEAVVDSARLLRIERQLAPAQTIQLPNRPAR